MYLRNEKQEYVKVQAGDAIFWTKDEWHETKTATGLTAIVIESEVLDPAYFGFKKWNSWVSWNVIIFEYAQILIILK